MYLPLEAEIENTDKKAGYGISGGIGKQQPRSLRCTSLCGKIR